LVNPLASSRRRAWVAVVLGLAGVATMPVALEIAYRSPRISLLQTAYAVPLALVLGVLAAGMARRAQRNIEWLGLDRRGTGVASAGVILGVLAISLALTAALSVGFYEAVEYYHRHY
jgi:hypothetical protein